MSVLSLARAPVHRRARPSGSIDLIGVKDAIRAGNSTARGKPRTQHEMQSAASARGPCDTPDSFRGGSGSPSREEDRSPSPPGIARARTGLVRISNAETRSPFPSNSKRRESKRRASMRQARFCEFSFFISELGDDWGLSPTPRRGFSSGRSGAHPDRRQRLRPGCYASSAGKVPSAGALR